MKNLYFDTVQDDFYNTLDELKKNLDNFNIFEFCRDIDTEYYINIQDNSESIAKSHIDGKKYETVEDVLKDEEKIDKIIEDEFNHHIYDFKQDAIFKLKELREIIDERINCIEKRYKYLGS